MQPFRPTAVFGAIVWFTAAAVAAPPSPSAGRQHVAECWQTQCQRDSLPVRGCGQYGLAETKRAPCASADGVGHVYTCCWPTNASVPTDMAAASGSRPFDNCRVYDESELSCTDGYQYVCCANNNDDDDVEGTKTGWMTLFHLAMTACGKKYNDHDMVGAVGPHYFSASNPNNDPVCGKKVMIIDLRTSKSVVVKIVDKCGGCSKYDINVSPGAFKKISPSKKSKIRVKWAFVY